MRLVHVLSYPIHGRFSSVLRAAISQTRHQSSLQCHYKSLSSHYYSLLFARLGIAGWANKMNGNSVDGSITTWLTTPGYLSVPANKNDIATCFCTPTTRVVSSSKAPKMFSPKLQLLLLFPSSAAPHCHYSLVVTTAISRLVYWSSSHRPTASSSPLHWEMVWYMAPNSINSAAPTF